MLLRDEDALEETIKGLVEKIIKSQDGEAREELSTIEKTINVSVSIACEANFEPDTSTLSARASFESFEEFEDADDFCFGYSHDFENQYDIRWDDECGYGTFALDKSSVDVSVEIDGLTEDASDELKSGFEKAREKYWDAKQKEIATERVEKLRKELESAELLLKDW